MKMLENIKSAYQSDVVSDPDSGASTVEFILIAGSLALLVLFVMKIFGISVGNKAADLSDCIQNSSTITTSGSDNCDNIDHSKNNDFKNDPGYKTRFGNG